MALLKPQSTIYFIKWIYTWLFIGCCFSQLRVVESKIGRNPASLDMEATNTVWDHSLDLNNNFRLLWTIINDSALFEVQVRTHGYVGFGFSATGREEGADIAIGWVDKGQTFFQDRHVPVNGSSREPVVDPSQDYILLMGYENTTHTVIRFRRKLDTCDSLHDISITSDTMRLMFLHNENDPMNGSVNPGSLPNVENAWHQPRSVVLIQRSVEPHNLDNLEKTRILEFRNTRVELPYDDGTMIWCKFFKLDQQDRSNHIVKYEPIYDSSWSFQYLQYITLYECTGIGVELEALSREPGHRCMRNTNISCHTYLATWSRGSPSFIYPPEVGYRLDAKTDYFLMMETHYNNMIIEFEQFEKSHKFDSSGLRLYITEQLRANDAGLMSLGIEPNWHHIIPPGQNRVVSQGHCIEQCTDSAFPSDGINIFGTMMRTHQIGVEIKLRQIRNMRELPPIVADNNIDPNYQTFRQLPQRIRSLPGDRLVTECVYDSSSRSALTLGGSSMKEESCIIFAFYYPRQKSLTSCHSSPSLATVLHSLGIEYLNANSDPVVISLPLELKGMTLETRLLTYDWQNQFKAFQDITLNGSFKALCQNEKVTDLALSSGLTGWPVNFTQTFVQPNRCNIKHPNKIKNQKHDVNVISDITGNDIVEVSVRNSRSSISETLALSGIGSSSVSIERGVLSIYFLTILTASALLLS